MADEPNWLSVADLIEINRLETAITGEPHGVLSHGLPESACAKPMNRWAYVLELADASWR